MPYTGSNWGAHGEGKGWRILSGSPLSLARSFSGSLGVCASVSLEMGLSRGRSAFPKGSHTFLAPGGKEAKPPSPATRPAWTRVRKPQAPAGLGSKERRARGVSGGEAPPPEACAARYGHHGPLSLYGQPEASSAPAVRHYFQI
jgi:hypothetical protein